MSDWLITPLVLVLGAGILFIADRSLGFVFQPTISADGIRVRFFGKISVAHIPLDQIQEIGRQSWFDLFMEGSLKESSHVGGSWFRKPVVVWRRDRGPFLLSLRDPDGFIAEVKRYLAVGRLTSA